MDPRERLHAAVARHPFRAFIASGFVFVAALSLRTAERLLDVPSGSVIAARIASRTPRKETPS
jgi:hypothetical protein